MSVQFLSSLDLRSVDGPYRLFQLLAPLKCIVAGHAIDIPEGFLTDFASVPRPFKNIIDDNDPDIQKASVLHDYLYSVNGNVPGLEKAFTRAECDVILRDAMAASGSTWRRRNIVWLAVRIGGWVPWSQKESTAVCKAYSLFYSVPRNRKWESVRAAHLKHQDWCRVCGRTDHLQVHHIKPFYLFPHLELEPSNLITLCEAPHTMCHLKRGHLGSWKKYNPAIAEQATAVKALKQL